MSIEEIRSRLARRRPALAEDEAARRAAVALVLTRRRGPAELLLIHRAEKAGDPWSGQMAFPGGRMEAGDGDLDAAARRETLEEVGLSLHGAEPLGRLDDLYGHRAAGNLVVSAFVYHLPEPGALTLQESEVQDAFFFPFDQLADPARHVRRRFHAAAESEYPGVVVGEAERHVVWGLTYRFIEVLHQVLARDFPGRVK